MRRLLYFVPLALCLHFAASENSPFEWQHSGTFYFAVSSDSKNWESARDSCKKNGGDLAVINSKSKQDALLGKINTTSNASLLIGLRKRGVDVWKWVDGENVSYSNWAPGQPSDETRDCGAVQNLTWVSVKCCSAQGYVCGREAFLKVTEHSNVTMQVLLDESRKLRCPISGFPQPNIAWYKSGRMEENDDELARGDTITLLHLNHTGNARYYCRADNGHDKRAAWFTLVMTEKPEEPSVKSFLPQETPSGNLGDDIMLTCGTVTRHVNYTWFKGGHVIDHGAETTVRLRADQDFGDYTCFASNKAGNSSRKISVRKKAKEGRIPFFMRITLGCLSALVLVLFLAVALLCRKICQQKSFTPVRSHPEEDEEKTQVEKAEETQHDPSAFYMDLLPRQQSKEEMEDTRPTYVNTTPRHPDRSRVDSDSLYEPLQPLGETKEKTRTKDKTRTPSLPKYVNVPSKPFKYAL